MASVSTTPPATDADPEPQRWRLGYVPALDGLRACAVAAVVMLHAGLSFGRGGQVGVDVFFVLSGFLITSLLLQEWDRHQHIGLKRFYIRRALRLFPALALLLLVTLLLSIIRPFALPHGFDTGEVLGGAAVAFTYTTDLVLAFTSIDVGPFFHTWSLAVEEHFYLIWPPLLVLALRAGWTRKRLVQVLIGLLVAIFVWRLIGYHASRSVREVIYGYDLQPDQLVAGCLAAVLVPLAIVHLRERRALLGALALAGAAVIALVVVAHPSRALLAHGGYVAIYVSAAVLIVWLATGPVTGPLALLSTAPFVYVGKLSYSIYLWHFVVFHALTAEALGTGRTTSIVIRVLVTLALSMASYHLVEQRFLRLKGRWEPDPAESRRAAGASGTTPETTSV